MKIIPLIFLIFLSNTSLGQNENYLDNYGISKDSINELTFKSKNAFDMFIKEFEEKEGFQVPKFLIIDNSGKLLKHKLDIHIMECGKGDVIELRKRYFKKLPKINQLNEFFNEKLETPNNNDFIVIFIWHEAVDKYNKHTFETYQIWKDNENIKFYFLELNHE